MNDNDPTMSEAAKERLGKPFETAEEESQDLSIAGLEAMTLRVSGGDAIVFTNSAFARYAGKSKAELAGVPLSFLRDLFADEELELLTRPSSEGDEKRLIRDARGRVFEFKTTRRGGYRDIVIQDVSDRERFEGFVRKYIYTPIEALTDHDLRTFKFPERREMTVSFTDMRGFTAMSEKMEPEGVREVINAYLEEAIRAVRDNKATVDKIVGDEVMALYGAPRYYQDHALRAIKTACDQLDYLAALRTEFSRSGRFMPEVGIGINTGEMVLGNIGSSVRQDYTVLGASVNLAARLCGAARAGEILLTERTLKEALACLPDGWEVVEAHTDEEMEVSDVKGKTEGVFPLPEALRRKVVVVGPGVRTNIAEREFAFHYAYCLKAKGIEEPFPVLSVWRSKQGGGSLSLDDQAVLQIQNAQVFGKYRLIQKIGMGGMGEVWLGKDHFGRKVAIKMLRGSETAGETQIRRFQREAEVMTRLETRHIVRIYEVGEYDKIHFIAMEHVEGASLDKVLRHRAVSSEKTAVSDIVSVVKSIRESSLDPAEAGTESTGETVAVGKDGPCLILPEQQTLALIAKVCEGIQVAHESGVLHRDLKPGNIMVRPDGEPVVMDFGLAKVGGDERDMNLSMTGQIMGTIEYMAPEQARSSKDVDERADVYSLGAILYQMLAGQKHFEATGNILSDAQALQEFEPKRLRLLNPKIAPDLEIIVLKALRPDPEGRYRSVRALGEDLGRYCRGEVILAKEVGLAEVGVKWVKRNRVLSAVIGTSILLMVAGAATSIYQLNERRIEVEAALAQAQTSEARAKENEARALESEKKAVENEKHATASEAEALAEKKKAVESQKSASQERDKAKSLLALYEGEKKARGEEVIKLKNANETNEKIVKSSAPTLLQMGREKLALGNAEESVEYAERALALDGALVDAVVFKARAQLAQFQVKAAMQTLQQAKGMAGYKKSENSQWLEKTVQDFLPIFEMMPGAGKDRELQLALSKLLKGSSHPDDQLAGKCLEK